METNRNTSEMTAVQHNSTTIYSLKNCQRVESTLCDTVSIDPELYNLHHDRILQGCCAGLH